MRTLDYVRMTLGLAAAVAVVAAVGCSQGGEGDRCVIALNANGHDECGGGTTCTAVPYCPETYCCPLNADGTLAANGNPNCQPGCAGGAASICNAGVLDGGACTFACQNDPGDLANASVCAIGEADGGGDGGAPKSPEAGPETGADAAHDAPSGHPDGGPEAATPDAGPG